MSNRGHLWLVAGFLVFAPDAVAQRDDTNAFAPATRVADSTTGKRGISVAEPFGRFDRNGVPPWWTPLASAAIPGSGQAVLHQDRFVGYLAVEAYTILQYVTDSREAERRRSEYRELARRVARGPFSDERPTGDFAYYEKMTHYLESGVYDLEPGGELQPETDTSTYNGDQWLLARRTFWPSPDAPLDPSDPAYVAALNFYRSRAISPEYRWSWRNAQLEQDIFRRTIGLSNDAVRRSIADLGIILANHALSMVDAYISVRLQQRGASGLGMTATIPLPSFARSTRHSGVDH